MIVSMVQLIYYYLHFFGTRKRSFLISLQRYIQDLLVSRIVETWKKMSLIAAVHTTYYRMCQVRSC